MKRLAIRCLNCNLRGHKFQYCKNPIRSYGVIAYRVHEGEIQYIFIQRRNSIGYTDFLRGKYKSRIDIDYKRLDTLICEMTNEEITQIKTQPFDKLWDALWLNHTRGIYVNERERARTIFNSLDIKNICQNIGESRYDEPEYGFPKGRINLYETEKSCAFREFQEETGLNRMDYEIVDYLDPIKEEFRGSDGIEYFHLYYIAKIKKEIDFSKIKPSRIFLEEIKQVSFLNYKDSYRKIRDYDYQKKNVLTKIHKILTSRLTL